MSTETYKITIYSLILTMFVMYMSMNYTIDKLRDESLQAKQLVVSQYKELNEINHRLAQRLSDLNDYIELKRLKKDLGK